MGLKTILTLFVVLGKSSVCLLENTQKHLEEEIESGSNTEKNYKAELEQIEKQLNKLIPVIKVKRLEEGEYIGRELLLIKVSCTSKKREEIMGIAQLVQAKIVDVSSSAVTLEYSEEVDKIDILLELLRPFGIKEIVRTGKVAIEKGHGEAYHSGFND